MIPLLLLACLPSPTTSGTPVDDVTDSDTARPDHQGDDGGGSDGDDSGTEPPDDTSTGTTDDSATDDSGPTEPEDTGPHPDVDVDDDGWTSDDGDCDDHDDAVHPGLADGSCDAIDQDCDGDVNEDFDLDLYEPNDASTDWTDLGDLDGDLEVEGYLFPSSDVDAYFVWIGDDLWTTFSLEGTVTPPSDVDVVVQLWRYGEDDKDWTPILEVDDGAWGDAEAFSYGGDALTSDSAFYAVVVLPYDDDSACDDTYRVAIEG